MLVSWLCLLIINILHLHVGFGHCGLTGIKDFVLIIYY